MTEAACTKAKTGDRRANGTFKKGYTANPGGRPRTPRAELEKALEHWDETGDDTLFKHIVKRAKESDTVLVALMKKILPDLRHSDIDANVAIKTLADIAAAVGATRLPERLQERIGASN